MVYKAEVTTNTTYKEYYGMLAGDNDTQYFRHISRNYPNTFRRCKQKELITIYYGV